LTTFLSSSHLRQKASAACGRKNIVGAKIRCQFIKFIKFVKLKVHQVYKVERRFGFNPHHQSHPDFTSFIGIGYELSSHPDIDYYLIGIGF